MTANRLPPQAYTRATLTLAYDWLKSQPESTRKIADSADSIVALYLQSQRYKAKSYSGHPKVSSNKNSGQPQQSEMKFQDGTSNRFQSELKSLAKGFKAFENPKPKNPSLKTPSKPPSVFADSHGDMHPRYEPAPPSNPPKPKNITPEVNRSLPANEKEASPSEDKPDKTPRSQVNLGALDHRTLEILHETQAVMNLSSETEALRLLIAMGFERIRSLVDSK